MIFTLTATNDKTNKTYLLGIGEDYKQLLQTYCDENSDRVVAIAEDMRSAMLIDNFGNNYTVIINAINNSQQMLIGQPSQLTDLYVLLEGDAVEQLAKIHILNRNTPAA